MAGERKRPPVVAEGRCPWRLSHERLEQVPRGRRLALSQQGFGQYPPGHYGIRVQVEGVAALGGRRFELTEEVQYQPGGHARNRGERIQLLGDVHLLDGRVAFTLAREQERVPVTAVQIVRLEAETLFERLRGAIELPAVVRRDVGERDVGGAVRRVELQRPPRSGRRRRKRIAGLGGPDVSQYAVAFGDARIRAGVCGVPLDRPFVVRNRLAQRGRRALRPRVPSAQVLHVRLGIDSRAPVSRRNRRPLGAHVRRDEPRVDALHDGSRHVILQIEDVGEVAVVAFGP
jgi:hypothetical protein